MIRIFSGLDSLSRPKCIQSMGMGVFDFNVSSVCTCTVACLAYSNLCRFVIMNILWQKNKQIEDLECFAQVSSCCCCMQLP